MRHRGPRRHPGRLAFFEPRIEYRHEPGDLLLLRQRLVLRGHFAAVDLLDHLGPEMRVFARSKVSGELIDAQVALLLLRSVAADAMRFEEDLEGLVGRND